MEENISLLSLSLNAFSYGKLDRSQSHLPNTIKLKRRDFAPLFFMTHLYGIQYVPLRLVFSQRRGKQIVFNWKNKDAARWNKRIVAGSSSRLWRRMLFFQTRFVFLRSWWFHDSIIHYYWCIEGKKGRRYDEASRCEMVSESCQVSSLYGDGSLLVWFLVCYLYYINSSIWHLLLCHLSNLTYGEKRWRDRQYIYPHGGCITPLN